MSDCVIVLSDEVSEIEGGLVIYQVFADGSKSRAVVPCINPYLNSGFTVVAGGQVISK